MGIFKLMLYEIWRDTLFPPQCLLCERPAADADDLICRICLADISKKDPVHEIEIGQVNRTYVLYEYNLKVQQMIHLLKYERFLKLARLFAQEAITAFPDLPGNGYEAIMPVPLHPTRYRERGYNQSAEIGRSLMKFLDVPMTENLLFRRRNTPSQTRFNREQREANVSGAFDCSPDCRYRRVLLIDDVITTGSTCTACAVALRTRGVQYVDVLAIANPEIMDISV